jgi:hypothetical protein
LIYYFNCSRPDFSDNKITSTSNTLLHQLIMFVTALYQVYVIWIFCYTGNKTFMKVNQWFYWTSNPQFCENFQFVFGAPKQSCSTLQNCELFCGNSSSSQELVIVGIKLGTVWSLFYLYWTSKLINLYKIPIIFQL